MPTSNTVYFKYCYNTDHYSPEYCGMVNSPLSPPVLKCSGLLINNYAKVHTRYAFRIASTNENIYITSQKYTRGDLWTFSLSDLSINPGTKLKVHADVISGNDSEPYMILEYDPTVSVGEDTPHFHLVGDAFYTGMLFENIE